MTDVKTLIEEARDYSGDVDHRGAALIRDLADALEETQRLAKARREIIATYERENADWELRLHQAERERDALAAVVEEVRTAIRYGSRMDTHPTRSPNGSVMDSELWWAAWHDQADRAWRKNMADVLATAPADALREHDARVWDEASDETAIHIENGGEYALPNPYRQAKRVLMTHPHDGHDLGETCIDCQRREEQDA